MIRRGDVIRFRGKYRLVVHVGRRVAFLIKLGRSWTDPCNRCSYSVSDGLDLHQRPVLRNVRLPICPAIALNPHHQAGGYDPVCWGEDEAWRGEAQSK